MPWPRAPRAVEGSAFAGEDLLAGLAGEVSHLLERGFEAAAVVDPLAIQGGVLGRQQLGDGLAALFPGELPVGAVSLVGVGAAAVGVVAGRVALDEGAFAGEADVGDPRLGFLVVGAQAL